MSAWRLNAVFLASLLVTSALAFAGTSSAGRHLCDPPEVETALEFADDGTAEGVAVSRDGDVFVGNYITGEIFRAPGGDFGKASLLADLFEEDPLVSLVGMDVDRNGNLYAAVDAFLDPSLHGVWRVRPDGTVDLVAPLPAFFESLPNDVTVDPKNNVYVSDSFDGTIWRLTPDGELSEWVVDDLLRAFFGDIEFGVNGLVYHKWALYGAVTLAGRIVKIPILPDGTAGTPSVIVEDPTLIGMDGIEFDPKGNIYVTNNFGSLIQRIRGDDLEIETLAGEGLSAPASLAFNKNHKILYVANLSTSAAFPGPPAPALVQVEFSAPVVSGQNPCG